MGEMRVKKEAFIFLVFFAFGILSRALLGSKDFTHMDGVLYALGTLNYSIKDAMPPSPGYFIYIMSAKLLNAFTHNPHDSLMFLSIFYSGLIAGTLYYFGAKLKGRAAGVASAVLFMTSPLFWYKGITIFGYLNSGFFVLLTALFGYLIIVERKDVSFWMAVSLGVLIGVRPQELFVMLPLYAFALINVGPRRAAYSLLTFFIVCALWLTPLVLLSGGLREYLSALRGGSVYLMEDSIFGGNFVSKVNNHIARMALYFERAYFLGIFPLVYYAGRFLHLPSLVEDKRRQFFAAWILPSILYNVFVQFGEVGHGMSWALGLLLVLGEAVVVLGEDMAAAAAVWRKRVFATAAALRRSPFLNGVAYAAVLVPITAVNLFAFFYDFDADDKMPFYSFRQYTQSNYNYVLKKNRFLASKVNFIKDKLNPSAAVVVTSSSFMYQAMYHLPDTIVIHSNAVEKRNNVSFWRFQGHKSAYCKEGGSFVIPQGLTKVIIFDEGMFAYVKTGCSGVYYDLDGGYRLLEIEVRPGQRIEFGYQEIRIG